MSTVTKCSQVDCLNKGFATTVCGGGAPAPKLGLRLQTTPSNLSNYQCFEQIGASAFRSPETPTFLSCSGLDNLKSQLGSFPFEMVDLSLAVLGFVEFGSLVHVLHAVAQHT